MIRPSLALLAIAALGLSACGAEQPKDYETDVVDKSGGELIVVDEDPDAVPVTLPETPMTNAPAAPDAPKAE